MTYSDVDLAWQDLSRKLSKDLRNNKPHITLKRFQDIRALRDDISPHVSSALIQALIANAPTQVPYVLPWAIEHYPVSPEVTPLILLVAINQKSRFATDILLDFGWSLSHLDPEEQSRAKNKIAETLGQGQDLSINRLCPDLFSTFEKNAPTNRPWEMFLKACVSENGLLHHSYQPSKQGLSWPDIHSQFNWAETEKIQAGFNSIFADVFHSHMNTGMVALKQFNPQSMQMVFGWEDINWLDMKKVEGLVLNLCKEDKKALCAEWFSRYHKHRLNSQTPEISLSRSARLRL